MLRILLLILVPTVAVAKGTETEAARSHKEFQRECVRVCLVNNEGGSLLWREDGESLMWCEGYCTAKRAACGESLRGPKGTLYEGCEP